MALPRSCDRRVPQESRGLVDVRAHDREAGHGCARAGSRKGEPARRLLSLVFQFPARFPGVPAPPRVPGIAFFKTLKRELVNGKGCKTREEAKQDVFKYIELYYNRQRMHSSIGYNAPCDLERDVA